MIRNSTAYSFRDPAGQLLQIDDRILRLVRKSAIQDVNEFLSSHRFNQLLQMGHLVDTSVLHLDETMGLLKTRGVEFCNESECGLVLEHEKIPFVSFPAEWPPEMLYAAGLLTIELAETTLEEGFGLKDATPYNILFNGPIPIFIDILSFEKRNKFDPTWLAYSQYIRTFLLPLFVNSQFQLSLDKFFLTRRDGIEPEKVYFMASPVRRLLPPFLHLVSIPVWLNKLNDDVSIYKPHLLSDPEKASFILLSLFKRLKKRLNAIKPISKKKSTWSNYFSSNNNYSNDHFSAKCSFVDTVLTECKPNKVLDVGCNTGYFSEIAARCGAYVVAIDYDPVVVGELWRKAYTENLSILPLVVNLTRPTPALGWLNGETPSFLDRAVGSFDTVLMLAVIHHMLVTERIPLKEIVGLAERLTTDVLIIEYISPSDSMFGRLTRGRESLYSYLTKELFESECDVYFTTISSQHIKDTSRWLYFMRKKTKEKQGA